MSTYIYSHDDCLRHEPGPHHPESPQRLHAVLSALRAPEFEHLRWQEAPLGTHAQVTRVHSPDYVDQVQRVAPKQGYHLLDAGDTVMSPGTLNAVMRCVGALCEAVDAVVAGRATNAFCATRPCGHHAEAERAMGFCVFNQAAIAALHARHEHGIQRVAVIDFDVHHGNGTQHSFENDADLFFGSTHQAPFYPGTGARNERGVAGNIVNIPLERGSGSAAFRRAMRDELLPALDRFAPELVIVSAGFDAHELDPLGGLSFTDGDYAWITRELVAIARQHAGSRLVSTLEGGYSLEALATGSAAHVRELAKA